MGQNGRAAPQEINTPSGAQDPHDPTTGETLGNVDDMEKKLDEVDNRESHRTKDGRAIKVSS